MVNTNWKSWSYYTSKVQQWYTKQCAIPEIRCTPPTEDMGISKILPTFFVWDSKKKKKKNEAFFLS